MRDFTVIYPEDVNRRQSFELPEIGPITQLSLFFNESSDFFGRVTIYDLQVEGRDLSNEQEGKTDGD